MVGRRAVSLWIVNPHHNMANFLSVKDFTDYNCVQRQDTVYNRVRWKGYYVFMCVDYQRTSSQF
jgi:hypothetical protein